MKLHEAAYERGLVEIVSKDQKGAKKLVTTLGYRCGVDNCGQTKKRFDHLRHHQAVTHLKISFDDSCFFF